MDKKFKQIYYSDDGYWRGKSAIQKLAKSSGSTKEEAEKWLLKQPLYQIYLPPPKYVPRPNASMSLFAKPNNIHQADILYLLHNKFKKKTYKYALNILDVFFLHIPIGIQLLKLKFARGSHVNGINSALTTQACMLPRSA